MFARRARDRLQAAACGRIEPRDALQEAERVRVAWLREQPRLPCRSRRIVPAYMTFTRSHVPATTPRSCVIRISAVPRSATSVAEEVEDLRLDRHVEGGRRLVGDEQLGSHASAIAIITRWRIPPEN